jgi:hypothetical protein|tara:strand:- start:540 stop:1058 length:519 start_codon:yes stop_codon:yes gene_type:complete
MSDIAFNKIDAPNEEQHKYEVMMSYHKDDRHLQNLSDSESSLAWAELHDNRIVVFKYHVIAGSIQSAINRAIKLDDQRKSETGATWPSIFSQWENMAGEPLNDDLLEKMYHFLQEQEHFEDWFNAQPTTVSAILLDNKPMVHKDMENQFIEKNETFISDIADWANKDVTEEE